MKARLPQGMGGGPSNMQGMLKQAQKMQEDMARVQEELAATTYSATVGGGMVTATVDGSHELKELTIQPDAVDPDDVEMLTDLVIAAVNEAIRKAAADSEEKMGAITGGMSLPGLF
ncbi:MAG: YbaB/EbfC family nucleoid-associated protein [Ruminococcaceae bacterium]|nr:YbaB/EbfC family nucleoid-associated protein [Oscillospiraceae bacterium]